MQTDQAPQPSYDFILKEPPRAGKSPIPKLSRPALIIVAALLLIILLIIFGSLLGQKKSKVTGLSDVIGLAQEINRVSQLEENRLQDPLVLSLANTSQLTLASDQSALKNYMSTHKYSVDAKKIADYKNSQTDSQLDSAAQNNTLDSAYVAYLRASLAQYAGDLKSAYAGTTDSGLKKILKDAYGSVQTLLTTNPLKQSSSS